MNKNSVLDSNVIPYRELFQLGEHEIVESLSTENLDPLKFGFYEFLGNGMHFMRITSGIANHKTFCFKSDKPYISLVYSFKSRSVFKNKHSETVFADIHCNQCGIIYINDQIFENNWIVEPGSEIFVINVTIEYFKRFLPADHPLHESFLQSVSENLPVTLNERTIEVIPRMRMLLNDIFQNDQEKYYKFLFLRSRFIELLMLQFQEYEAAYKQLPDACICETNLEKMYEVRDIIDCNLKQSCTLLDLAQQVGTNECYLKKHFKQVFGTTVFGYMHTQRMLRSKELLLNEDIKIAEVAKLSGYKHASHFTTAFKKYFGYLPHQIKLLILSFYNGFEFLFTAEGAFLL